MAVPSLHCSSVSLLSSGVLTSVITGDSLKLPVHLGNCVFLSGFSPSHRYGFHGPASLLSVREMVETETGTVHS